MDWRVPLSDLDLGVAERQAVMKVLQSRWLSMGEVTERFERAFAEMVGVKQAIAVSNATVGLHLVNLALGVGEGDEVWIKPRSLHLVGVGIGIALVEYVVQAVLLGPNQSGCLRWCNTVL